MKEFSGAEPRVEDDGWIFIKDVRDAHVCIREEADPDSGEPVLLVKYSFPRARRFFRAEASSARAALR